MFIWIYLRDELRFILKVSSRDIVENILLLGEWEDTELCLFLRFLENMLLEELSDKLTPSFKVSKRDILEHIFYLETSSES